MRMISPSELTDFTFCQKYWFNTRKLNLVSQKIGHRDLAAMMGITVGWWWDQHFKGLPNENYLGYFNDLVCEAEMNGRRWDFGIDDTTIKKVEGKITSHLENLQTHQADWLQGGNVIASEFVLYDWGEARLDLAIEGPTGEGIIADFKCKYGDKAATFATSRDVDLYGNQKELYPLAWNSREHPLKMSKMRFIYSVEGKPPLVHDVLVDPRRQARWLQAYQQVCQQIEALELTPETMCDKLTENPYHRTPWGECGFLTYCMSGEHDQGVLNEFIQIERKEKR